MGSSSPLRELALRPVVDTMGNAISVVSTRGHSVSFPLGELSLHA